MLLLLKLILVYLALAGVLWGICRFIQGVFYLEVPASLWWRALVGAGVIWFVALVWPLVFNLADLGKWPLNFDDMFLFHDAAQTGTTYKELVVFDENNRPTTYRRAIKANGQIEYRDSQGRGLPITPPALTAVPETGEGRRFTIVKDADGYIDRSKGSALYQDGDGNQVLEASFYTGAETTMNYAQFILTLFADVVFFTTWFLVLWLIMLFQWPHALLVALPSVFIWALVMNVVI